jgi:hypothetical protein
MVQGVASGTKSDQVRRLVTTAASNFPNMVHVEREDTAACRNGTPIPGFRKNERDRFEWEFLPLTRRIA